jgi:quercetin dioxygenase-like cupin family protein
MKLMDKNEKVWVFNRDSDTNAIVRNLSYEIKARIFVGEHSMLSFVRIPPHKQESIHKHSEEQWGVLLEGTCLRLQDDHEKMMKVGDFWYTPGEVLHGVKTLKKPALILDIFSPPRETYREKGEGFGTHETK